MQVGEKAAGALTGLAEGTVESQSKHVARRTPSNSALEVMPGNQFPAPISLDTQKRAMICLESDLL